VSDDNYTGSVWIDQYVLKVNLVAVPDNQKPWPVRLHREPKNAKICLSYLPQNLVDSVPVQLIAGKDLSSE